jgi:hypothetical protein
MREEASRYSGPHEILLNRNERNLGVGAHVNRIVALSKGVLVVEAAGDDVSMPGRVRETVEAWERGGRRPTSIYSAFERIDEAGAAFAVDPGYHGEDARTLADFSGDIPLNPRGCAHAFARELMLRFGEIDPEIPSEDQVIAYRSALSGSFAYIDKPLVRYRVHGASLTSWKGKAAAFESEAMRREMLRDAEVEIACRRQNLRDALLVLDASHAAVRLLRRRLVETGLARDAFGARVPPWRLPARAAAALSRGARVSAVAKVVAKVFLWPLYARYFDARRKASIRALARAGAARAEG